MRLSRTTIWLDVAMPLTATPVVAPEAPESSSHSTVTKSSCTETAAMAVRGRINAPLPATPV
jgi:hypothetical protein